jgi:hypothetical protein
MKPDQLLLKLLLCIVLIWSLSCDHGLAPSDAEEVISTGISGTIEYSSIWPVDSTLFNLKLVVFKQIPIDSTQVITDVIGGEATVFPENLSENLPYYVDSTPYSLTLEPGFYAYIVVVQQYGTIYQWRVVGQFDETPADSLPTGLMVFADSMLTGIDISVDWNNPPFQPF